MTALYDIVVLRKQDHPFPYLMLLCRIGGGSEVIMKKRIFSALLAVSLVIALGSFITACKDTDKAVDYSDFAFTKTDWIRETEVCTETLPSFKGRLPLLLLLLRQPRERCGFN